MDASFPAAGVLGLPELGRPLCFSFLSPKHPAAAMGTYGLRGSGCGRKSYRCRKPTKATEGDLYGGLNALQSADGSLKASGGDRVTTVSSAVGVAEPTDSKLESAKPRGPGGDSRDSGLASDAGLAAQLAVRNGKALKTVVDSGGALALRSMESMDEVEGERVSTVSLDEKDSDGRMFSGSLKGMLFLNLGAALFGSNQVVIKATERNLSPGVLSAVRFLIAAVCFSPSIAQGLQKPKLRSAGFELGCWLFGGYTAQALGLVSTTAGRGAFTGTFTVLVVPLLVGLSGRKISASTWIAAAVTLVGVGCLTTSGADPNIGDLWCIISAILFGIHKWRSEALTGQFEETTELVAVQIFFLALASLVYCIPQFWHTIQDGSWGHSLKQVQALPWPALAYMGLGTTALTLWLEMSSLKEVSSPLAALIYTAEPVWGSLFAYLFLEERWGALGWVGAALIIGSSLFSQLCGDTEKRNDSIKGETNDKKIA